jgi:hypothetical protein
MECLVCKTSKSFGGKIVCTEIVSQGIVFADEIVCYSRVDRRSRGAVCA